MTTAEQFYIKTWRDFVAADVATSEHLALPGNDLLPKVIPSDGMPASLPMLAVTGQEEPDKRHPLRSLVTIYFRLRIQMAPEADAESPQPPGTAETEATVWVQSLKERIRDTEAFRTHFLTTLSDAERKGRVIIQIQHSNAVTEITDKDTRTKVWQLELKLHIVSAI